MNGSKLDKQKPGDRKISLLNQARRGLLPQDCLPLKDFAELCVATDAPVDETRRQECYSVIQSWTDADFVELEERTRGEVVINPVFFSVIGRAAESPLDRWWREHRGDVPDPRPKPTVHASLIQPRMDLYISRPQATRIADRLASSGYVGEGSRLWLMVRTRSVESKEIGRARSKLKITHEFFDRSLRKARNFDEAFRTLHDGGHLEKRNRDGYTELEISEALVAAGLLRVVFQPKEPPTTTLLLTGNFGRK